MLIDIFSISELNNLWILKSYTLECEKIQIEKLQIFCNWFNSPITDQKCFKVKNEKGNGIPQMDFLTLFIFP